MGVTIHYSGRFNPKKNLAKMIEELKDVALVNRWDYKVFETEFPKPDAKPAFDFSKYGWTVEPLRYGIYITPPRCETIDFAFDASGNLERTFVKTQFAGSATHIIVVNLLRYISKKYLLNFEVDDEGDYWQTNDTILLEKHLRDVGNMIKVMGDAFNSSQRQKGEELTNYIIRVATGAKQTYDKGEMKNKRPRK